MDSDKTQVRSILHDTARQHWQKSRFWFGTTPISFSNMYKPGGHIYLEQVILQVGLSIKKATSGMLGEPNVSGSSINISYSCFSVPSCRKTNKPRLHYSSVTTTELVVVIRRCYVKLKNSISTRPVAIPKNAAIQRTRDITRWRLQ